jgi:hypothetical protein
VPDARSHDLQVTRNDYESQPIVQRHTIERLMMGEA